MPDEWLSYLVYVVPMFGVWAWYAIARRRRHERAVAALAASREAGLIEPASLHPWIDPSLCLGCATCVDACPEGEILGLVHGKAVLVEPSSCIGHGACRDACPQNAITLVLGSETRGVEIPRLGPDFQSNVPGLFVAGELGGMGLIRNAIVQGCQAMDSAAALASGEVGDGFDVTVVGAGPAGFAASLRAKELGLSCLTLEQDTLGGTVAHYPRGKVVMTAPVSLPLFGRVRLRETSKEALLDFWREVEVKTGIEIHYQERVKSISKGPGGFELETERRRYRSRAVVLAIGRRGTPRRLGVPGEECEKVVYRLVDPEQYRGQRVLVVGGGDSAIEAALDLSQQPGTEVALSYRGDAFSRAKKKNRERLRSAEEAGALQVLLPSTVSRIAERSVFVECREGEKELANDAVLVCAGGILPTGFLRATGVEIETRHGEV